MEKLVDTSKSIHDKALKYIFKYLKNAKIKEILDAGSGKTSASVLLKYFPKSKVDAIIYPGDNRKKNPIETAISSSRLNLTEADICKAKIEKKYDLCLIHLTLGEALNFKNPFELLFAHLMDIKAKYFVVYDILEDPCVHYRYMEQFWKERNFLVLKKKIFKNPNPEHYPKVKFDKYKLEFDSKHYVCYLLENKN